MSGQMGEIFLARQQMVGFKKETTNGTAATLDSTNYKYLAHNLKIKVNIQENKRKYYVGDPYAFISVFGAQSAELSMDIHVQGSGSTSANPAHWDLLEISGFAPQTATTLFRATCLTIPCTATGTFEFEQKENAASSIRGKKYKMKGCVASKCTEHYSKAGELQIISFTFIGALTAVTDLSAGTNAVPVLTADVGAPPAVLSCQVKYGSLVLPTNGITIDYGLVAKLIEYPPDPTGYSYAVISDVDPIVNLKCLIQLEATLGAYAILTNNGATDVLKMTLGSGITGGEIDTIFPVSQIVKALDVEARDGIDEAPLMFRAIRNPSSLDGFAMPIVGKVMPIA